jgi:hypothetical protein
MIFRQDSIDLIRRGQKTQTRRPVQDGEGGYVYGKTPYSWHLPATICREGWTETEVVKLIGGDPAESARTKWVVGRTYAVCPGRGKHQVERILLKGLRCQRLDGISKDDVLAEGLRWVAKRERWMYNKMILETLDDFPVGHVVAYLHLWQSMYPKSDMTELVWVLDFELVKP